MGPRGSYGFPFVDSISTVFASMVLYLNNSRVASGIFIDIEVDLFNWWLTFKVYQSEYCPPLCFITPAALE